ncbi:MAG: hypothetical protein ACTHKU_07240, partial [Verrucomicrobiota bacterium]
MKTFACFSKLTFVFAIAGTALSAKAAAEPDVRRDATVTAIEQVMPSVVNIHTRTVVPVRDRYEAMLRQFYGQQPTDTSISIGSGVVIDETGYLLTNDHV